VVLVPSLYLVRTEDKVAERLESFVANGGKLLMSFFSGIADENEHIYLGGYPAPFRKLLGLRVEEFDPYAVGQTNQVQLLSATDSLPDQSAVYECDLWSDVIDLEGASALATYTQDFYKGRPAITRHSFGQGHSYYLGTRPASALLERLMLQICQEAQVTPSPLAVPSGVEVVCRQDADHFYYFVTNHTKDTLELKLPAPAQELLTQAEAIQTLCLEPYGVAILAANFA
jgi:beta-galactosidase